MKILERLFSLEGKVAIVTGGARGNGKAIAQGLSEAGADVILVDIIEELADTACELDCEAYSCDITDSDSLRELVEYVLNKFHKIDIIVNNAGVSISADFLSYPADAWEKTYRVNLKAPFELIQLAAEHMKGNGGSIINITSLNGELAFPDNPAYVAFKGALRQLTKATAYDLGKYGIRANNLAPGYIKTAMTNQSYNDSAKHADRKNRTLLGRWGRPEDLVGTAIFLASDASSYITGQDIYVDGGWSAKGI